MADTPFRDLFSKQASTYASIRPDYPPSLFDFLASHVVNRQLAWDAATGNGQAAVPLAAYFERVIATDASKAQLAEARQHPRVEYRVGTAEESGLPSACADLITVAQALHWFDRPRFYDEVRRVARPEAVIAVWSYGDPSLDDKSLDPLLQEFNFGKMGAYWPPGRGSVGKGYLEFEFPFDEIATPALEIERLWTLTELATYLRSWSARARYVSMHNEDPVAEFETQLGKVWGDPAAKQRISWPLVTRAARVGRFAPADSRL